MLALPSILGAPAPKVEANAAVLSYERQKQGASLMIVSCSRLAWAHNGDNLTSVFQSIGAQMPPTSIDDAYALIGVKGGTTAVYNQNTAAKVGDPLKRFPVESTASNWGMKRGDAMAYNTGIHVVGGDKPGSSYGVEPGTIY